MGSKANGKTMDDVKELYMQFMRCPDQASRESIGLPKTRTAFAAKFGLDRSTMWRWEQSDDFKRDVTSPILEIVTPMSITAIIRAQEVKALDGNTPAAKFIMDITGMTGKLKAPPVDRPEDDDFFAGWSASKIEAYLAAQDEDAEVESED
jgi:hypothetical protein